MVPRESGAWGPRLAQRTAYTVDAKSGKKESSYIAEVAENRNRWDHA
jgi:hypothetical protein